jgi:hypothetical protein
MKFNKSILIQLTVLVAIAALYRIIPNRPFGFAPQIAIALFSGAIFKQQKSVAFLLPLLSMFISDALYEILYVNNLSNIPGFYKGQFTNYALFISLTFFGFAINSKKITTIIGGIVSAPTVYFLVSNSIVWLGNGGFKRGQTFSGYLQTLIDGLPFYYGSLAATAIYSAILFVGYHFATSKKLQAA